MHVKSTVIIQKYKVVFGQVFWRVHYVYSRQQQAEQLGREDQQRLHRNKKLVLMVDLDQTLIHTTEQHCPRMSNKVLFLHITLPNLGSMSFVTYILYSTTKCMLFLKQLCFLRCCLQFNCLTWKWTLCIKNKCLTLVCTELRPCIDICGHTVDSHEQICLKGT